MYRIMIVKSKKDDYASLYQYLTQTVNGVVSPMEFPDTTTLDAYVESMLNSTYSKSDFIIVQPVEYTIDAKDFTSANADAETTEG